MTREKTRDLILWLTVFAGPVFWLVSFQAKLSWNTWTCAEQTNMPLFLFALTAFLLTAGAGLLASRQWHSLGANTPSDGGDPPTRARFMALGAVIFSIGFCLIIIAQAIPDLIIDPCQ